jgi:hypothetical protein
LLSKGAAGNSTAPVGTPKWSPRRCSNTMSSALPACDPRPRPLARGDTV